MSVPIPGPLSGRRNDLDWIRVGAFVLLIFYHVGMFYVPWPWHVKSPHQVEALEPIMRLVSPWRLTLLFLVSGSATRFMVDGFATQGKGVLALAGSRTLRLLPPLLFGMFVIVAPQSYYQVYESLQRHGVAEAARDPALANFWLRYATASGHWCDPPECLLTPTYNHLWYVVYLLLYSLVLALLLAVPGVRRGLQWIADRAFHGWGVAVWPLAYLLLIRLSLAPVFKINHAVVGDWYNHALSFGAFLFGFLTARSEAARQAFLRLRWPALFVALLSWAGWATYTWVHRASGPIPPAAQSQAIGVIYAANQWASIAAILGFGARRLNHGGPVLRYLTTGVFPFYIAHQTVIVVAGHNLAALGLPFGVEATLLIVMTALGSLATYEVARRIGWFGLLLGVRPRVAGRSSQPARD